MIDLGCLNQPMMMSDRKLSRRVDLGDASDSGPAIRLAAMEYRAANLADFSVQSNHSEVFEDRNWEDYVRILATAPNVS
jgi:hypothetical protein